MTADIQRDGTNQEDEVDKHKQDLDAHRTSAFAVPWWALFTAQFNETLTCRLHSTASGVPTLYLSNRRLLSSWQQRADTTDSWVDVLVKTRSSATTEIPLRVRLNAILFRSYCGLDWEISLLYAMFRIVSITCHKQNCRVILAVTGGGNVAEWAHYNIVILTYLLTWMISAHETKLATSNNTRTGDCSWHSIVWAVGWTRIWVVCKRHLSTRDFTSYDSLRAGVWQASAALIDISTTCIVCSASSDAWTSLRASTATSMCASYVMGGVYRDRIGLLLIPTAKWYLAESFLDRTTAVLTFVRHLMSRTRRITMSPCYL